MDPSRSESSLPMPFWTRICLSAFVTHRMELTGDGGMRGRLSTLTIDRDTAARVDVFLASSSTAPLMKC